MFFTINKNVKGNHMINNAVAHEFGSKTLNSRKPIGKCKRNWFCKKMTCERCIARRRDFFVKWGSYHADNNNLNTHLTLSFGCTKYDDPWLKIHSCSSTLSKKMSGIKAGPFIRVYGVGPKGGPHIHFLVNDKSIGKIIKIFKSDFSNKNNDALYTPAPCPEGLLGYFFDKNFVTSYSDPNRVKGMRLISASRPMPCCFPTYKQELELDKLLGIWVVSPKKVG